ncbi:hypothetical protein ACFWVM_06310 [Nocardia fluminea]|uniref:NucA/NucB deoxyribonuclease domain-containing protein n=1 Tax=Nocardia fluminea TaxID=134984 RepID=UPI00364F7123
MLVGVVIAVQLVSANAQPPSSPSPPEPAKSWKATDNPNATVVPGQMRSDRETIPGGFSKSDADKAETMEAAAAGKAGSRASLTPGCQTYWPSPYEVCGAIKDKYNSLGGPNSFLLWPTSNELTQPDGIGRRSVFTNGPIYWSPNGGAHPVVNHFFAAWQRNGWEGGVLGYPTSDEITNSDGVGRRQYFVGGTIYWKLNEAYYVAGAIRDKWGSVGWEGGYLGYPTSDETATPDGVGRFNRFENGMIYWSSSTGAHPVSGGILIKWGLTNFETGPYGYPVSDQRQRGQAFDQDFQFGTLGWPTTAVQDNDIDWQEDTVDDGNCSGCGDDNRVAVTGPGYTNAPQPSLAPTTEAVTEEMFAELPQCKDVPIGAKTDVDTPSPTWCQSERSPGLAPQASWTSALDKTYCKDLPRRQWAGDRTYQCMWRDGIIALINKQNGQVIGTLEVVQENQLNTVWNSTTWNVRTVLHIVSASSGLSGAQYAMSVYCVSDVTCSQSFNNSESPHPVSEALYQRNYTISAPVGVGAISRTNGFAEFTFTAPGASPVTTKTAVSPVIRCDQIGNRNTSGCIVAGAEPILDLRNRNVPALAGHIGYAQSSGLPGAPNGTPLTRTTNNTVVQNNRNISCNRVPGPRPAGQQCDEYPFASSLQGGGANGPTRTYQGTCATGIPGTLADVRPVPVTFWNSAGVSLCMMPGRENMRGGGITGWFYTKNRVLDGDTFYVKGA